MSCDARRDQFPSDRSSELGIPLPPNVPSTQDLWHVPAAVVDRFNDLADERHDEIAAKDDKLPAGEKLSENAYLPFHPLGTPRNLDTDKLGKRLRLKTGDIVYFAGDATNKTVNELAFSAIWRDRVEEREQGQSQRAGVRRFFEKSISSEVLPFNPKRRFISPAETLFGFAEQREKDDVSPSVKGRPTGYAGRVRVGYGRLLGSATDVLHPAVTLKTLSSPKPPCPPMYFKPSNADGYLRKRDLDPTHHRPRGRKFYLHAFANHGDLARVQALDTSGKVADQGLETQSYAGNGPQQGAYWPWASAEQTGDTARLKLCVEPIKENTQFVFHLDFDNLTESELDLLCFCLRPAPTFRHKLGLGKPIGLGSVRVDPVGLFLTERNRRYAADPLFSGRYHHAWYSPSANPAGASPERIRAEYATRYGLELKALDALAAQSNEIARIGDAENPTARAARFAESNRRVARILITLGDPGRIEAPVHYPQAANIEEHNCKYDAQKGRWPCNSANNPASIEEKNFLWFVGNDNPALRQKGQRSQFLASVEAENNLPTLERHPFHRRKGEE